MSYCKEKESINKIFKILFNMERIGHIREITKERIGHIVSIELKVKDYGSESKIETKKSYNR